MNTILITGVAKIIDLNVKYAVYIWGSNEGNQIQLIATYDGELSGYNELWEIAKQKANEYLKNDLLTDGAYTQYLDHIVLI